MKNKLFLYKSMRNSDKTPEPFTSQNLDPKKLHFVIQKHKATRPHYDFRLEVNSVMTSWAVPKGPTLDPSFKRLAMQTENHPLDYQHFEGTIPDGQYGAGEVIIWDRGTYWPEKEENGKRNQVKDKKDGNKVMQYGLKKGEIKFFLSGIRLKGSFALVKTRAFAGKNAWLLIKHRDNYIKEGFDAKQFNTSVVSKKVL